MADVPAPHHPRRIVGAIVREAQATVATAVLPWFGRRPMPEPKPVEGRRPVILVHGFLGHPEILRPIAVHLLTHGWPRVERVQYSSFGTRFEQILDQIDAIASTMDGRIDLVGHSLGAVACRAWIQTRGGAARCERFVALAAPFGGTSLFRMVPGPLRRALDPRGEWVTRLATLDNDVQTTVIRARYDTSVLPSGRTKLAGDDVREVLLDGLGHNGMLWSPRVAVAVAKALSE